MGLALFFVSGCAGPLLLDGGPCRLIHAPVALPAEVPESSGVVPAWLGEGESEDRGSRTSEAPLLAASPFEASSPTAEVYWTHNDSGWDPVLFGVTHGGSLQEVVRVVGAENVDWEDLAAGPCTHGRCLVIADTGDNLEEREHLTLYRVPEPQPGDTLSRPAEALDLALPHGPRDVEALLLLPDDHFLLVSKGRSHPVEVYRTPATWPTTWEGAPASESDKPASAPLQLERVQQLTSRRPHLPRMVTGGAVTPDGRLAVIRSYEGLHFYEIRVDGPEPLHPVEGGRVNLRPLREAQGEAVAFVPGNRLVLTSEAGPGQALGQMSFLECRLPGWSW